MITLGDEPIYRSVVRDLGNPFGRTINEQLEYELTRPLDSERITFNELMRRMVIIVDRLHRQAR